jgi:ribA/ribD-fused uncharacterized protein
MLRQTRDGTWICPFFTKKYVFSNHYPARFVVEGITYNSAEQYYMRQKALFFGCTSSAERVLRMSNPSMMKTLCHGSRLPAFNSDVWEMVSEKVMATACAAKFRQNDNLRKCLLETGSALMVEAAPRDFTWGVGLSLDDERLLDRTKWKGKNRLGNLLTQLREEIRSDPGNGTRPSG